jgi:hypothetical protein
MKYKIGYNDPTVYRDGESGVWNSEPATLKAKAQRLFILANIGNAEGSCCTSHRCAFRRLFPQQRGGL